MPICLVCGEDRIPACATKVLNRKFAPGLTHGKKTVRRSLRNILSCEDFLAPNRVFGEEIFTLLPDLAQLCDRLNQNRLPGLRAKSKG